jgi:hypothetical protein
MLWSLLQSGAVWLESDMIYVAGLVMLVCGLWFYGKGRSNDWIILLLGWILVVQSFLMRFGAILSGDWYGKENFKIIALARAVLHTLVVPLAIVFVWCAGRLAYEQVVRRRKSWQTLLWCGVLMICAWWCGCYVYFVYTHFGVYPDKSLFP